VVLGRTNMDTADDDDETVVDQVESHSFSRLRTLLSALQSGIQQGLVITTMTQSIAYALRLDDPESPVQIDEVRSDRSLARVN
jgi:hypothetical protein